MPETDLLPGRIERAGRIPALKLAGDANAPSMRRGREAGVGLVGSGLCRVEGEVDCTVEASGGGGEVER